MMQKERVLALTHVVENRTKSEGEEKRVTQVTPFQFADGEVGKPEKQLWKQFSEMVSKSYANFFLIREKNELVVSLPTGTHRIRFLEGKIVHDHIAVERHVINADDALELAKYFDGIFREEVAITVNALTQSPELMLPYESAMATRYHRMLKCMPELNSQKDSETDLYEEFLLWDEMMEVMCRRR